jgi:hypothetical protein
LIVNDIFVTFFNKTPRIRLEANLGSQGKVFQKELRGDAQTGSVATL